MELYKKASELTITNRLRIAKSAEITVDDADGTSQVVSLGVVEILTAATTLTKADSGKTLILNSATEFAVTLPAPKIGLRFKFIVSAAPVGAAYTVVTNGGANLIDGSATVAGLVIAAANEDTITFTASAALSGDWVELVSDGTNWFVGGQATASTGIAFTAT